MCVIALCPPSEQVSERTYTALDATVDEYMQLRDVLGLARGVLVQPSVYGLDNETTLRSASKIPNVKSVVVIDQTAYCGLWLAFANFGGCFQPCTLD